LRIEFEDAGCCYNNTSLVEDSNGRKDGTMEGLMIMMMIKSNEKLTE
jgi:hypothetical protein